MFKENNTRWTFGTQSSVNLIKPEQLWLHLHTVISRMYTCIYCRFYPGVFLYVYLCTSKLFCLGCMHVSRSLLSELHTYTHIDITSTINHL